MSYHMTDLLMFHYELVSKREGFFGKAPQKISFRSVVNDSTKGFMKNSKHQPVKEQIDSFSQTDFGKMLSHIYPLFNLKPKGFSIDRDAHLSVMF